MDLLSREDLGVLVEQRQEPCVSLFLPTQHCGAAVAQNPTRLKNLLRQAQEILVRQGRRPPDVRALLEPVQTLVTQEGYWRLQSAGLALFVAPDFFRAYRLPVAFSEMVVVAQRFHIKPLLMQFTNDGRFHILTLHQNGVRLYLATRDSLQRVPLTTVPKNVADANRYDVLQREMVSRSVGSLREGARMVYGHGGIQEEDRKLNIRRFFHDVDRGLRDVLKREALPLLAVGLAFEVAIYREANTYPRLLEAFIDEQPERLDERMLHARARALMAPYFEAEQHRAAAQFDELNGTGRASTDLPEVLRAAQGGRVGTLFVAMHAHQWGRYDPAQDHVALRPDAQAGDDDLLDLAAVQTILHDGAVFAVPQAQVPQGHAGATLAAVFRY